MIAEILKATGTDEEGIMLAIGLLRGMLWKTEKISAYFPEVDVAQVLRQHDERRKLDETYSQRFAKLFLNRGDFSPNKEAKEASVKGPAEIVRYILEWNRYYRENFSTLYDQTRSYEFRGLTPPQILGLASNKSHMFPVPWAKQSVTSFFKSRGWRYSEIARLLDVDHTTILHALKQYNRSAQYQSVYKSFTDEIIKTMSNVDSRVWDDIRYIYQIRTPRMNNIIEQMLKYVSVQYGEVNVEETAANLRVTVKTVEDSIKNREWL